MSKRRVRLIWLLLIIAIICCSTHTSWGQEDDSVNISYPSSLPAKSEVTHENILNQAQRSLDRSIDLFNTVATVMGVFAGLISLLIALAGIFAYIEINRWKELNKEAEGYVKKIETNAKEAEKIVDNVKEVVSIAKPVFVRLEQIDKNAKISLDPFRERAKDLPYITEPFSEDQKTILDEYGKKIEFLEAFGVQLKPEDYFNRGTEFYWKEKYELALTAYNKAIELNPDYFEAWNNKGVTLRKLDQYDEALTVYETAIDINPDYVKAWNNKGFALDDLGRYGEALTAYDKAIELKPDYVEAWNNKGVTLRNLDQYDEALTAYDTAIDINPNYADAWYNKADSYSRKGDKENVLKCLSKAIDLDVEYKEMAKSDADFKNLWDDEDFKRIVS